VKVQQQYRQNQNAIEYGNDIREDRMRTEKIEKFGIVWVYPFTGLKVLGHDFS